jgi:hypothetical protein
MAEVLREEELFVPGWDEPVVYPAYVPDPLAGRIFTLEGEVAADVADAEAAILRLNAQASSLANTEAIARLLLRAEAVACRDSGDHSRHP